MHSQYYYTPKGDPLFSLTDLSNLSGITTRQIRKWIESGDLKPFITAYIDRETKIKYYHIGPNDPDDELVDGSLVYYWIDRQNERPEWSIKRRDAMTYQNYHRQKQEEEEALEDANYETGDIW